MSSTPLIPSLSHGRFSSTSVGGTTPGDVGFRPTPGTSYSAAPGKTRKERCGVAQAAESSLVEKPEVRRPAPCAVSPADRDGVGDIPRVRVRADCHAEKSLAGRY
jgi:hypothetical protein